MNVRKHVTGQGDILIYSARINTSKQDYMNGGPVLRSTAIFTQIVYAVITIVIIGLIGYLAYKGATISESLTDYFQAAFFIALLLFIGFFMVPSWLLLPATIRRYNALRKSSW